MAIRGPFQRPSLSFCVFLLFVFGFSFAKIVLVVLKKMKSDLEEWNALIAILQLKLKVLREAAKKNRFFLDLPTARSQSRPKDPKVGSQLLVPV